MRLINWIRNAVRHLSIPKRYWLWVVLLLAIPILGLILSLVFWDWLNFNESRGTTIRNVGLIIAALTALPLAIWRGLVAERQADAAQQGLRNERYQKGAEMLGSDVLSVRLGGIYALQRLAEEYPEEYHIQIMSLLCAFVCHSTKNTEYEKELTYRMPKEIAETMKAIGSRTPKQIELECKSGFRLLLSGADLSHLFLPRGNLSNVNLIETNLSDALLWKARLSDADMAGVHLYNTSLSGANLRNAEMQLAHLVGSKLIRTSLRRAKLGGAKLFGVHLDDADLSCTDFSGPLVPFTEVRPVTGLTQAQLNQARADPDNPPKLEGVLDAETGKPLVWTGGRGAPLKD